MNQSASILRVLFALAVASGAAAVHAQLPPHAPGTICATPVFWCWAAYAGRPGTTCACPVRNGWVQGVLM